MPTLVDQLLEENCVGLSSTKVTERKKCVEKVFELLEKRDVIASLNDNQGDGMTWSNVVKNLHWHLAKEAEKLHEEEQKKRNKNFYRQKGPDLLINTIRKANTGKTRLTVTALIEYIICCFTTPSLVKYFADTYVLILKDAVLSDSRYYGAIEEHEWMDLLKILKSNINNSKCDGTKVIECLELLLKWGPLHKLPMVQLRNEFPFITELGLSLMKQTPKRNQEVILKILIEFCNQHCRDCCLACCKLGEIVFKSLRTVYEVRTTENTIKNLMLEFFLLQVKLHHPNGSLEGSSSAYAHSWTDWNKQLRTMHHIIQEEFSYSLVCTFKSNNAPFCYNAEKRMYPIFAEFVVRVLKQVFNKSCNNIDDEMDISLPSLNITEPSAKRPRTELGVAALIADVQESKTWQWINITTELLQYYPEILTPEDFLRLLRVLCNLQSECKDSDVLSHIYECLYVLIDIEKCLDVSPEVHQMWSIIWDFAIRSAGLNQNIDVTHNLLQKLITQEKIRNDTQLFEAYTSGALAVNKHSLTTLRTVSSTFGIPESPSTRKKLLNWMLNVNVDKCDPDTFIYGEKVTAELLVMLCMKQWHLHCDVKRKDEVDFDVETVYLMNAFEHELILQENKAEAKGNALKSYVVNPELLEALLLMLEIITGKFLEYVQGDLFGLNSLNFLTLTSHTLSFLIQYKVVTVDRFDGIAERLHFKEMISNAQESLLGYLGERMMLHFKALLSADVCCFVAHKIREFTRNEFIEQMYSRLSMDVEVDTYWKNYEKELCVGFLCSFCCVEGSSEITNNQNYVLTMLSKHSFDVQEPKWFKMVMMIVNSLSNCKPGTVPDDILQNILEYLLEMCRVFYTQYEVLLNILVAFSDLLKHFLLTKKDNLKEQASFFVQNFYNLRDNYGPKVSLILIKCMRQISEVNPVEKKWNGVHIPLLIAMFLKSDYEEVRLVAIRQLLFVFRLSSHDDGAVYQLQKQIFDDVNVMSREVFRLEMTQSTVEQRKIDETVTRTATVLYTYGALMVVNSMWRRRALYSIIELVYEKKLNTGFLLKLLDMVVRNLKILNVKAYLDEHIDYLLQQWKGHNHALSDFPHEFLGCLSEKDFYDQYCHVVTPILVENQDVTGVESVAQHKGKSVAEVVEISFPRIMALSLLNGATDGSTLQNLLGVSNLSELLSKRIDYVLLNMIQLVFDVETIKEQLDIRYEVPHDEENHFSLMQFTAGMALIEEQLSINTTIIEHCVNLFPDKIQSVVLKLTVAIHKASGLEDQLKALHHYTIFINLLTPFLKNKLKEYLVKHITYSLLHITTSGGDDTTSLAACNYLKKFCQEILPNCAEEMEAFLFVIVNKLIPLASTDNNLGHSCVNTLNFLIVENADHFKDAIESLDPFPQTEAFRKVNEVKKPRGQSHLRDDIRHFLGAGGDLTGNRREALRCLKLQLAAKKNELKSLYDALQDVRGFYEDCKDSLLHQLIAMLVRLTASSDTEVSLEATRCLGEIGPADLTTVILQPQTTLEDSRSAPLQFTTMFVIQSLCEYAVDADIEVVQVASQTLYDVLDTKEGKVIIDGSRTNAYAEVQRGFLTPFLTKRRLRADSVIEVDMGTFQVKIDDVSLWYPAVKHELWIRSLVCALLECFTSKSYLSKLIPMCKVKVSFCEQLFPYLIYLIMHHANPTCVNIISKCMDDFFDRVWRLTLLDNQDSAIQKSSVHCMLNVVHFVRLQTSVNCKEIARLSINYLKVAQAAYFCSTYFSALLYVELWCQAVITRLRNLGRNSNSASTTLDVICHNENKEVCENLQAILRRTYTALGDLDALNGCGYMHLLDTEKRMEHYKELGKWEQVVLHYDIQTAHNSHKYFPELSDALKNCQLYQLALNYNQSKGEVDYECFWRLNQYTDVNKAANNKLHGGQYIYTALKSLCEKDSVLFTESITSARNSVIESLKNASLEGTKGLYNSLSQLRCIQELEEVHAAKQNNNFHELFEKWKEQNKLAKGDFKYVEPIKAQRISMLTKLLNAGFATIKNALVEAYLNLSGLAREECDFKVANWAMENLSLLPDLSEGYKALKMYEESQIYWSTGVKPIAKFIVNHLVENNEENLRLRFACLKLYGKWMVETHSENPRAILHNYLLKALNVMRDVEKTSKDCEDIFDTYDVIARFADAEYQKILSYIKSSEFERKVKNMDKSRTTAQKIQTQSNHRPNIDEKRAMIIYKQQSMIDETEIERTYKEKDTYLIFAAKYYLLNLQFSDANNTRIFRIFSLWLDNRSNSELPEVFEKFLPKIPSYKYISILPQLVPHLNNNSDEEFAKQICSIIERCCKDHPHHTLPILLALANSNKDDVYSPVVVTTESNEPRVLGAQKLLQNLKQEPTLLKLITDMENLSEALLELAYLENEKCQKTGKGELIIPSRARITRIKNLSDVLLPTCTLEVNKARNYANIVGIHSFGKEFVYVGGINKPKKVTCRGTDGITRTQLVKGKDDLRQDAVMQQVFTIMNTLLRSNKQTSKLLIRTYKVVPLSRRSGVLEWVENSLMIGEFLAQAHKKYNTGDWSIERCKQAVKESQRASNEIKLQKFELICKNFRPIMHKFFEVNFPQPVIWYERRRAYMHSVATSSMCGYILGLGDRHVLNILIDKTTAEVIHIDFGIAFEQGRMLPTPETVPFRLTRDIEDGMGVSGIEGVFRRSCEKTMEVLRQNSETIVTILEVLLYDPLYAWTITPAEAYSKQFSDEDESIKFSEEEEIPVNVSAERALLKLRQKLQGMEEGSTSSVEGQVEKLLQEARDYANLSRLYFGWQAFL